ncbi:hypothetical protein C9374_008354 [Naegleria lovaniensis]|uniref:BTB domain-containing protein n=1 Tax=Naegleria lovaniensis TaxID=51637 RepID=A0AA88GJ91_NAELO|nr:uncharacterized protein C9374_008354 [Naegleria lovaniensis]KAG2378211.1 hypothetical protein C9374_008354 [Naegleria lovaniensis]
MALKSLLKNFAQKVTGIGGNSSSNDFSMMEMELKFESKSLQQFPKKVLKYSSQYNDSGVPLTEDAPIPAWSARNVTKGISSYPHYGDSGSAWCPAGMNGNEWIEVEFEIPVLVNEVHVYEVLGTGSTSKISAMVYDSESSSEEWVVLWEDSSVVTTSTATTARDFCPTLTSSVVTKRVRVDLKITNAWSEIDTIKLVGLFEPDRPTMTALGEEYSLLLTKADEMNTYSDVNISLKSDSSKQIPAHKGLLATRSSYLYQVLIECGNSLELDCNISFDSLYQAILFCYTNHCTITEDNIFEIFELAQLWKVEALIQFCKQNLAIMLSPANVLEYYKKTKQNNFTPLTSQILSTMAKHSTRLKNVNYESVFSSDDLDALKKLIKQKSK